MLRYEDTFSYEPDLGASPFLFYPRVALQQVGLSRPSFSLRQTCDYARARRYNVGQATDENALGAVASAGQQGADGRETADGTQQTTNSSQQTANSKQQTTVLCWAAMCAIREHLSDAQAKTAANRRGVA